MPKTLETGIKLFTKEDYTDLWLSIFDQIFGSSEGSTMNIINSYLLKLNEHVSDYYFELDSATNQLYVSEKTGSGAYTNRRPLGLMDSEGHIASKVDGTSVYIDTSGVLHGVSADDALNKSSENAIQNKAVATAIEGIETKISSANDAIKKITNSKGISGGYAELDTDGKVPSSQLPSYVDDVLEYDSSSAFPDAGYSGKIYIAKDTNITYRWGGTVYVPIGSDLALGETEKSAYRGDRGKIAYDHSQTKGNPHELTTDDIDAVNINKVGAANGVASLDNNGKVPKEQIPITEAEIATTEKVGVVKPDGKTIFVSEDGTLSAKGGVGALLVNVTCPVGCEITATSDTGETIVQTSTAEVTRFELTDYGTWSFVATKNGDTTNTATILADVTKLYTVTLAFFMATIEVTVENGATVTIESGSTKINATSSDGKATLTATAKGTWTVYATKDNVTSSTTTVNVTTEGETYTASVSFVTLTLTSPVGCDLTVSKGSILYNTTSSLGVNKFYLPETGTWNVSISQGDKATSKTIEITEYKNYDFKIAFYTMYAMHINQSESNPSSMITYPSGYANSDFTNYAHMDYSNNKFVWGDWADAWFIPRSCMLKYDGTVDYYLDENDETKKENGEASDVANASYGGNAMVEWGLIYWKFVPDADGNGTTFIMADAQVDDDMKPYCNYNNKGNVVDHFYTPKYFGSSVSGKMRSISGTSPMVSQNGMTEISYATANGDGWYTEVFGDRILISMILLMMAHTTDTQTAYGSGRNNKSSAIDNGTMNKKGMFWGDTSSPNGVKVFGMENWWGNIWRRTAGLMYISSVLYWKICYGTADGSTTNTYNTTSSGYIKGRSISGTSSGYINSMYFTNTAILPKTVSGSQTTYYTDGCWFDNGTYYVVFGGGYGSDHHAGALFVGLNGAVSDSYVNYGSALSYKPLS